MNWDDLQYALAVSREGTLSAAAARLRVNASTVGRRLDALEHAVGQPLFSRTRPRFILTEAGEALVSHAQRIESETIELAEKLEVQDFRPQGLVRIATNPWLIDTFIIPNLAVFNRRYPDIEIDMIGDVRERSPSKREVELALRFELQPRGKDLAIEVATIGYAVYAHKEVTGDNLPWIAFGEDVSFSQPALWTESERRGQERVALRTHDAGFIHRAIHHRIGKGLIPEFIGDEDPTLRRLSGAVPEIVRRLYIHVSQDMFNMSRTRTVIAWLEECLATRLKRRAP